MNFWKLPADYVTTYIYQNVPFKDLAKLYLATSEKYTKSLIQILCALLEKGETEEELDVITLCLARIVQYSNESPEGAQRWCPQAIAKLIPYIQTSLCCSNTTIEHRLIGELFQNNKINSLKLTANDWKKLPRSLSGATGETIFKRLILLFIVGDEQTQANILEQNQALKLSNAENFTVLKYDSKNIFAERLKHLTKYWPFLLPSAVQNFSSFALPPHYKARHLNTLRSYELRESILGTLISKLKDNHSEPEVVVQIISEILSDSSAIVSQEYLNSGIDVLILTFKHQNWRASTDAHTAIQRILHASEALNQKNREAILDKLIVQFNTENTEYQNNFCRKLPGLLSDAIKISSNKRTAVLQAVMSQLYNFTDDETFSAFKNAILSALNSMLLDSKNDETQKTVISALNYLLRVSVGSERSDVMWDSEEIHSDTWKHIFNVFIKSLNDRSDISQNRDVQFLYNKVSVLAAIQPNEWESSLNPYLSNLTEESQDTEELRENLGVMLCSSVESPQKQIDRILSFLILTLDNQNCEHAAEAIQALGWILSVPDAVSQNKRDEILTILILKLNDHINDTNDINVIEYIAEALGKILSAPVKISLEKCDAALDALIAILRSPEDEDVQQSVAEALVDIFRASEIIFSDQQKAVVLETLISHCHHTDQLIQQVATEALGNILSDCADKIPLEKQQDILKTLIVSQLQHNNIQNQKYAAEAVGKIFSTSLKISSDIQEMVLNALISILQANVYNASVNWSTLSRQEGEVILQDQKFQTIAADVLHTVLSKIPQREPEVIDLFSILNHHKDIKVKEKIIAAINKVVSMSWEKITLYPEQLDTLISQLDPQRNVAKTATVKNQIVALETLSNIVIKGLMPLEKKETMVQKLIVLLRPENRRNMLQLWTISIMDALSQILSAPLQKEVISLALQDKAIETFLDYMSQDKIRNTTLNVLCVEPCSAINALGNILSASMVKVSPEKRQAARKRLLSIMMSLDVNVTVRTCSETALIKIFDAMFNPIKDPQSQPEHWMTQTHAQKLFIVKSLFDLVSDFGNDYIYKLIFWYKDDMLLLLGDMRQEVAINNIAADITEKARENNNNIVSDIKDLEDIIYILHFNSNSLKGAVEVELDDVSSHKQARVC